MSRRSYPSVGIDPATFEALKEFAQRRDHPMQQIVSQAVEAVLAGEIILDPAVCSRRLQATTMLLKSATRTELAVRIAKRRHARRRVA